MNNEIVCFKVFPEHLSNTEICELCQLKRSYKLIGLFLTRNLKDSYVSVNYSLLTDDWKSMSHRKNNIDYINFKKNFNSQLFNEIDFKNYERTHIHFFNFFEKMFEINKIPFKKLDFNQNINENFNIEEFINNILN